MRCETITGRGRRVTGDCSARTYTKEKPMLVKRSSNSNVARAARSANRREEKLAGTRAGVIEDWRSSGTKAKGPAQRTATVRDGR